MSGVTSTSRRPRPAPRIVVPARRVAPGRVGRKSAAVAGFDDLDALIAAGAMEMVVAPRPLSPGEADDLLGHADGLCLLGGGDLDPQRYGRSRHPATYGVDTAQDDFEIALLDAARRAERPVLAICRGMQLVNVALGGSLEQHLGDRPDVLQHAMAAFPKPAPGSIGTLLPVRVAPSSRLHRLLAAPEQPGPIDVVGAHSHHQAVDRLGAGLRAVAHAHDGVIEAVEHDTEWIVAVQWHPEDTARDDPAMQRLYRGFVAAARAARDGRPPRYGS